MTESDEAKFQHELARLMGLNIESGLFKKIVLFDTVEKERDRLKSDLEKCRKDSVVALEEKEAELSGERKAHQEALDHKDKEKEEVKGQYEKRLREAQEKYTSRDDRVTELEGEMKALKEENEGLQGKLNLKPDEFIKLPEGQQEIEKRAGALHQKWEKETKPTEVEQGVSATVKAAMAKRNLPPDSPELPKDELSKWILAEYRRDVSKGLNEEFDRRVNERVNALKSTAIDKAKNEEWPAWFNEHSAALVQLLSTNVVQALQRPWTITCGICHTQQTHALSAGNWDELIRTGATFVDCANVDCKVPLLGFRNRIWVKLVDLLQNAMTP
jgi:hypothetical protein